MSLSVLVIEDDAGLQEIIRRALELEGHSVDSAATAGAALARVRSHRHDIVLLDLILPDADGVLLHGRMSRVRPEIAKRTIFMTGFTSQEPVVRYLKSLCAEFLHKPFSAEELVRAVERVARGRSGQTATAAASRRS